MFLACVCMKSAVQVNSILILQMRKYGEIRLL